MKGTNDIVFETCGRIGTITLNRPQALNALNLSMIRAMDQKLVEWAKDDHLEAVVITGAGDRAFCAGGDVKAVAMDAKAAQEGNSDGQLTRDFFREEYILNHRIHSYPKPYISLVNGIVMGGGMGISAHGSHRVVTENTLFAMPETSIGLSRMWVAVISCRAAQARPGLIWRSPRSASWLPIPCILASQRIS